MKCKYLLAPTIDLYSKSCCFVCALSLKTDKKKGESRMFIEVLLLTV